jgi:hypothetical protein
MTEKFRSYLKISLQIILAIIFIFSAYSKLISPGIIEVMLIDQGIVDNREAASYIIRIFIAVEFAIGFLFLQKNLLKSLTIPLTWILLFVFTVYLFFTGVVLGEKENCGCFGEMIIMSPVESIIKNIFFAALSIVLFRIAKDEKSKPVIPPVIIVLSFASVFLASPIRSIKDFKFTEYIKFVGKGRVDLNSGSKLIGVFSLDCEHCQHAAKDLAKLRRTFDEIPEIYALFFSEGGITVDSFKVLTNSEFPYHMIEANEYFELIGNAPPRIYYSIDGKIVKYWDDQFVKNVVLEFKK